MDIAPKQQCRAITYDGERCSKITGDSSGLCSQHLQFFKNKLTSEVRRCEHCVLGKTEARDALCNLYMKAENGLCYIQVMTMFTDYTDKEAIKDEINWMLGAQKRMLHSAIVQNAAEGVTDELISSLLTEYKDNLIDFAKFLGMIGTQKIITEGDKERKKLMASLTLDLNAVNELKEEEEKEIKTERDNDEPADDDI